MTPTAQPPPVVHISEVFGPTVQGEGPYTGRGCVFVRLGGCNLSCAPCDTPYTWDGARFDLRKEISPITTAVVADWVQRLAPGRCPNLVVISGGEPLIHQHQPGFTQLVTDLATGGYELQFETNGTRAPARWLQDLDGVVHWVVSPKLTGPLATDPQQRRVVPQALQWFAAAATAGRAHFKIVVGGVGDVDQVAEFADTHRVPRHLVYVMPAGDRPEQVLETGRAVAEAATGHGLGLSLRAHLLLWPDESRGR